MLLAIGWLDIARLIVIGFAINVIKVDGYSTDVDADVEEQGSCGKRYFGDSISKTLQRTAILNGDQADKGEYPWQVSLRKFNGKSFQHLCGGTIIGDQYIITAAHCIGLSCEERECVERNRQAVLSKPHLYPIVVGDFDLQNFEREQTLLVADIYVHEQYPDKLKDIAIIKTTQKIKFGLYVQPACIARGKDRDLYKPGTTALLSGWGSLTGYGQSNQPQFLQEAEMIVRDIKDCNDTFLHTSPMALTDYMVCAGYWTGYPNPAACSGDSGGGLMVRKQGRFYLTGIASFVSSLGCGKVGFPDIYTDVSKFEVWINHHVPKGSAS